MIATAASMRGTGMSEIRGCFTSYSLVTSRESYLDLTEALVLLSFLHGCLLGLRWLLSSIVISTG